MCNARRRVIVDLDIQVSAVTPNLHDVPRSHDISGGAVARLNARIGTNTIRPVPKLITTTASVSKRQTKVPIIVTRAHRAELRVSVRSVALWSDHDKHRVAAGKDGRERVAPRHVIGRIPSEIRQPVWSAGPE